MTSETPVVLCLHTASPSHVLNAEKVSIECLATVNVAVSLTPPAHLPSAFLPTAITLPNEGLFQLRRPKSTRPRERIDQENSVHLEPATS